MKKTLLSLLLSFLSIAILAQTKEEKLNELLSAYSKMNSFNGTALVSEHGKILLNKGYGYKNVENKEANDGETIFQIGSITKQFTSTIILKLEEEGRLSLTDKISKYFPDFPNGDNITVYNLLTHTSGIFNYTNDQQFMMNEAVKPTTEGKIIALFKDKKLDFEPNTKYSYSNSGYMLLGYIIQKVTGKSYENVVREYVFNPLKMSESGFDFVHLDDPNKATGYFAIGDNKSEKSTLVDSSVSFAAGAIYTTTGDLLKWHNGLLTNKIVKRETIEKAFTPFKSKYGLGWNIDSLNKKRVVAHGGGIFGFNANFARIEQDDISIVLLNNVGNPKLSAITKDIFAILYDNPYKIPEMKKEIKVSEEILKKYIGTYEIVPQFKINVTVENGTLQAQATGQSKFELFGQKDSYFFAKIADIEIEFVNNEKGEIESLNLYQGGKKTPAKKIN